MDEALYAPLTAALIRRARPALAGYPHMFASPGGLAEDIRFFALSWAAGFAFFLTYFG